MVMVMVMEEGVLDEMSLMLLWLWLVMRFLLIAGG